MSSALLMWKRCACGFVCASEKEWQALPLQGYQLSDDDSGRYRTELRRCRCGSTLAIETRLEHAAGADEISRGRRHS